MTAYYVDSVDGLDANAGTSAGAAWKTWAKVKTAGVCVTGNQIYIKCGTTLTEQLGHAEHGGTTASPIVISSYGSGANPVIRVTNNDALVINKGGWIVENIDFYTLTTSWNGANVTSRPSTTDKTIIRNCSFTGLGRGVHNSGSGIAYTSVAHEDYNVLEFTDNTLTGYAAGFSWVGTGMFLFMRNRVNSCGGSGTATNAVSCSPAQVSGAVTFADQGGNVWAGTVPQQSGRDVTTIEAVRLRTGTTTWNLVENIATPTTPALGEYGYSGTTVYVNIGGNPTTYSQALAFGRLRSWVIADNIIDDMMGSTGEGSGIQADDFASFGVIRGNLVTGCSGNGIELNQSRNNDVFGNILVNNAEGGILLATSRNNRAFNNTIVMNTSVYGIRVSQNASANTHVISNNIIEGSSTSLMTYAVLFDQTTVGAQTYSCNNNNTRNYTTEVAVGTLTDSTHLDPGLDGTYLPVSALRSAGVWLGGQDYNGKEFYNPPPVGAVEDHAARSIVARSIVSRSTTTRDIAFKRNRTI